MAHYIDKDALVAEIEKLKEQLKSSDSSAYTEAYIIGATHTLNTISDLLDTLQEEPVSEDLEYASENYACRFTSSKYGHDKIKATFKAGANWQKEQMMKDAIGREVAEGSMCPAIETLPVLTHADMILLPKDKFKSGDKVKIIIIKED